MTTQTIVRCTGLASLSPPSCRARPILPRLLIRVPQVQGAGVADGSVGLGEPGPGGAAALVAQALEHGPARVELGGGVVILERIGAVDPVHQDPLVAALAQGAVLDQAVEEVD